MWVCKCVANTKALILTAGQVLTYGIQSNIRDLEYLYQQYGFNDLRGRWPSQYDSDTELRQQLRYNAGCDSNQQL